MQVLGCGVGALVFSLLLSSASGLRALGGGRGHGRQPDPALPDEAASAEQRPGVAPAAKAVGAGGPAELHVHFWIDDDGEGEPVKQGKALHATYQRIQGERRCLTFMHIPKTAGTSIETIGLGAGYKWGVLEEKLSCPANATFYGPPYGRWCTMPDGRRCPGCLMPDGDACPTWHVPPSVNADIAKGYSECETFCVVRDPLDRYRSENVYTDRPCRKEEIRADWLREARSTPYMKACHLVPQVQYVGSAKLGRRYCQHVLSFEHLERDFDKLMLDFGISARLSVHANERSCQAPILDDVKAEVHRYYAEDYAEFGYSTE